VAESYAEFPPGTLPAFDATSRLMTQTVADSFRLAFQLSLPFLLLAVLFNIALAGINRALPMVPVFMIGAPALVLAGLHLMAATMPTLLGEMLGAQAAVLVR
jgi:flagellar biosynthetic protein FliR